MNSKKIKLFLLISAIVVCYFCCSQKGISQTIDTLLYVGGYKLNFYIIKGKGMPILFETGGGDDASVWSDILKPVYDSTGATLITYSRAGFGKSELDTNKTDILNGIKGLETGLAELGYNGNLMIVCHSLGGFYTALYASRHSDEVKGAVLFDANHSCFFTKEEVKNFLKPFYSDKDKFKKENPAIYYTLLNFENTAALMRTITFPPEIPVLDLVAGNPPFEDPDESMRWTECHKKFVNSSAERELITATGAGHYVYKDNPELAIESIVRMYRSINLK
jgi:alpha/beta hydrolase fold